MEMLTKLNPKAGISEGYGGIPELTTSDIAACLSGADDIGLMILLRGVNGDTSSHQAAHEKLLKAVIRLAKEKKWKVNNSGENIVNLLNLCLIEYICPIKCPTCKGTGLYRYRECTTCHGTTNYTLNNTQRAKLIGVHKSRYGRTWQSRHKQVTEYINTTLPAHEYRAKRSIIKKLYGESKT